MRALRTSYCLMRTIGLLVIAVVGSSACGCSSKSKVAPIPVTGQVFLDGKPAVNAIVTFHPVGAPGDAIHPSGHVDEQGTFHLTTRVNGDGAPVGDYQVTVVAFSPIDEPGQPRQVVNALPDKYSKIETSNLAATVNPGSNTLEPFKLVSR